LDAMSLGFSEVRTKHEGKIMMPFSVMSAETRASGENFIVDDGNIGVTILIKVRYLRSVSTNE
jgi:hypothetical protein